MRTLVSDDTANYLLDFLASDGGGSPWICFAELGDWETLSNLRNEPHSIGRLARNREARGLAEIRRAALGMQVRLTPAGIALAGQRKWAAANPWAMIDLAAWNAHLESVLGPTEPMAG